MILDEEALNPESLSSFAHTLNSVCNSLQGQDVDFNAVSECFEGLGNYCLGLETGSFDLKLQALCESFRTVCLSIDSIIKKNRQKWTAQSPSKTAEETINQFVPVQKDITDYL